MQMDSLVSTDWLAGEIGAGDLRIVDASLHLDPARDARGEYEAAHIPGAVYLDLEHLIDPASPLPNTLPAAERFASRMQSLGLGDGSRIVVYDDSELHSAARAWFMLKLFGAHNVAVLDGGLAKWRAEGRETRSGVETLRHRHFTVWADEKLLRTKKQVLADVESGAEEIADARSPARFAGNDPEPRPGVEPGHIPGSRNVPASSLFEADGTYKDRAAIRAAFADAGIDLARPVVTTCGSGITAAVLAFGLDLLGKEDVALYDGSWAEWGGDPETPKAKGPA
jgi:thiosulfate/3-mercaptopyruvate sulfurtransferase